MPSHSRQLSPVRGGGLDALRFAASLFVVLFHFGDQAPVPLHAVHDIWARGYLATDFFLMLSGFVLARAYGRGLETGRIAPMSFWLKRFARSYPTHLITLGLLVVMVVVAGLIGKAPTHPENFPLSGIPAQVLLLHALGAGGGQWNTPAWTLSALLICYAAMPWLWRSLTRLPGPMTPLTLAVTLLMAGQVISLSTLGTSLFQLPYSLSLIRAFPLFVVGLLIARCVETANWTPDRSHLIVAFAAGLVGVDILSQGPDTLSLIAIMLLMLGCGSHVVDRPIPGAAWGAKVSFSLFMTHTLTGAVCFDVIVPVIQGLYPPAAQGPLAWVIWLGAVGAALVAADLHNRLIDAPLQKWIRARWFDQPRSVALQPASSPISS